MAKIEPEAMDLETFVTETIVQVIGGVEKAISKVGDISKTGMVNPSYSTHKHGEVQPVEFDVAVTVAQKTAGEGGGGVKVAVLQVGGKLESATENVAVNRVRFTVPVAVPSTTMKREPPRI